MNIQNIEITLNPCKNHGRQPGMQTIRQTNRQTKRETKRQTAGQNRQTKKLTNKNTSKQRKVTNQKITYKQLIFKMMKTHAKRNGCVFITWNILKTPAVSKT